MLSHSVVLFRWNVSGEVWVFNLSMFDVTGPILQLHRRSQTHTWGVQVSSLFFTRLHDLLRTDGHWWCVCVCFQRNVCGLQRRGHEPSHGEGADLGKQRFQLWQRADGHAGFVHRVDLWRLAAVSNEKTRRCQFLSAVPEWRRVSSTVVLQFLKAAKSLENDTFPGVNHGLFSPVD